MSARKPPDERIGHGTPDVGPIEAPPEPTGVPPARREWLRLTKDQWSRFWTSPVRAPVVQSADFDMLTRLFTLRDERERAYLDIRRPLRDSAGKAIRGSSSRLVVGSTGQMRPNGLYAVISRLDAEIRALELLFGISVKGRLNIGMVIGDGAGSEEDEDPAEDAAAGPGTVPPDPGLYLVPPLDGAAGGVPTAQVRESDPATG